MRRLLFPHLAVFVLGAAVLRVAVVPAEVCPAIDSTSAREAVAEAAAWLERGVQPRGRYTYGYFRSQRVVSQEYTLPRHAGAMLALYRVAAAGDRTALAAADHGLSFVRANLVSRGGWTAFAEPGQEATINASALAVAALVERRRMTGDRDHDGLIRSLARFLVAQQLPDGSVLGFWSPATGRPVPGRYERFGTGEALWALALVHRLWPREGWDRPARRLAGYVATRRDDVEGYVLPFADHWAAYGLAELGELDAPEREYARRLAGMFGLSSRLESQSGRHGLQRLFRGQPASGAGLGTIGEGLAQLLRLSREDPRLADLAAPLERRLRCTDGRLADRQQRAGPGLVRGAWFSENGYTQLDDQQHALSALLPLAR